MGLNYGNLSLHTDKYQINMMYAHWVNGSLHEKVVFEAYFRKLPFGNGYAVFAGLERIVDYMLHLQFTDEDIDYLRQQEEGYAEGFLEELRRFKFSGDLYAVREGTLVFAHEPLIRVEASVFEAQLVETTLLNVMNYQTLIATKASRIKQVAGGDTLLEFGTRRAQETDAAVWGARAAYIAGFDATSNLRAGMLFGIPTKGTHAHSWVQHHDTEAEAFRKYADAHPDHVSLLVDTYDTLGSGVPNAIRTAQYLEGKGKRLQSIRIDSGDIAYTSQVARKMLDDAGLSYVTIIASNDLDENIIMDLKSQQAQIDTWGVGTQLITAADQPSLGGVYKLVARMKNGKYEPVIKISGNLEKVTNPGVKEIFRLINSKTGRAEADYLALREEGQAEAGDPINLIDPAHPLMNKVVRDYEAVALLHPIFRNGVCVYTLPSLAEIRQHHQDELRLFWPQYLRKSNPEIYRVHLSEAALNLKMNLINKYRR
ncbi:nicotinate phosphoribosyltransferase [Paenibacillus sp. 598K]|nr:nicotinate phosphoribosyltransferase [Paenibacillus sp. 598K]